MKREQSGNAAWRALSDRPSGRLLGEAEAEQEQEQEQEHAVEGVLRKVGLFSPERVKEAVRRCAPMAAEEVRRAVARAVRKNSRGRAGLPGYVVQAMYADYCRLKSLAKTGRLYQRTRQAMYDIFRSHRLQLQARRFQEKWRWNGEVFTPGKNGYLRGTQGARRPLHVRMWEEENGPRPPGHQVTFLNGNYRDFRPENIDCLPTRDVTMIHYRRHYPERANWTPAERKDFWRAHNRESMASKAKRFVACGLRCDGRPLTRRLKRLEAAA
jgi:hypothetical protein